MSKQPTDFRGKERRNRSRSGRTLAERRLDYWRQLERLGTKVVTEHASLLPDELLTHHQGLEARIAEFEVYLDALRTTIAAEETGFRDYENKFLERLERERKKRKQLRARIHQDRPDQDALARQITLGEEELEILERRIADEEAKSAGEVHAALRDETLRFERRTHAADRGGRPRAAQLQRLGPRLAQRAPRGQRCARADEVAHSGREPRGSTPEPRDERPPRAARSTRAARPPPAPPRRAERANSSPILE